MLYVALLIFTLVGCGYFETHDETEPTAVTELEELKLKVPEVKAEYLAVADSDFHWPDPLDCDGVLWAGVARGAGVKEVQIEMADYLDGRVGRRPRLAPPCWTKQGGNQGSRSETSADMAQGRVIAFWRDRDLGGIQKFAAYGEAHRIEILGLPGWVLGEPYPDEQERVVLRSGMLGIVGRIIEVLSGGADLRSYRSTPSLYGVGGEDYQEALTVRGIILYGEVDQALRGGVASEPDSHGELPAGGEALLAVDGVMYDVLHTLADRRPDDPLFQAAWARYSGDYSPAYRVLLDSNMHCPSYTRGSRANCLANWLFAASLLVGSVEGF